MQYLIQMRLTSSGRPTTEAEGMAFIEQLSFPTLELCKKLQDEKKIVAGGPMSGAVALVLIVNAESARELDDLITSLPIWPRMETEVTALTTFEGRALTLRPGWSSCRRECKMRRANPQRNGSRSYVQVAACCSPGISGPYSKVPTGRRKRCEKLRKDRPPRKRGAGLGGD